MTLRAFGLLTDESIDPDVVRFLQSEGFDVLDVYEDGMRGATDAAILARAFSEGRVVITHDRDFGTLCVLQGHDLTGIVFLRPGHIDPQFTIDSLKVLLTADLQLDPPFIVVVHRRDGHVTIRLRPLNSHGSA